MMLYKTIYLLTYLLTDVVQICVIVYM